MEAPDAHGGTCRSSEMSEADIVCLACNAPRQSTKCEREAA
jgi:hypothetical protein